MVQAFFFLRGKQDQRGKRRSGWEFQICTEELSKWEEAEFTKSLLAGRNKCR